MVLLIISVWLELVDVNGKEITEMIESLVKNNVYVDPTLSVYESMVKDKSSKRSTYMAQSLAANKKNV